MEKVRNSGDENWNHGGPGFPALGLLCLDLEPVPVPLPVFLALELETTGVGVGGDVRALNSEAFFLLKAFKILTFCETVPSFLNISFDSIARNLTDMSFGQHVASA
jgi:hypothetical protein